MTSEKKVMEKKGNTSKFVTPPKEITFDQLCDEIENDNGDWVHDSDMGDR